MLSRLRKIFKQATFTIWQAVRLAYGVRPRWFVATAILNSSWGLIDLPLLWISKLLIDTVIEAIKSDDWTGYVGTMAGLLALQAGLEFLRQFLSRLSMTYNNALTRRVDSAVELAIFKKHGELDIPTIEKPSFSDKYDRIGRESSRRIWGLIRPLFDVIQGVVGLAANAVIVASFSPLALGVMVVLSLPEALVNVRVTKKDYQLRTKLSSKYRLWDWFNKYLAGGGNNYEVRLLNLTGFFKRRIEKLLELTLPAREQIGFERTYSLTKAAIPRALFFAGFNIYLFVLALAQVITLGTAQMIFRAGSSIQNYLSSTIHSIMEIYENQLYIRDLMWFLELKPKQSGGKIKADSSNKMEIEFRNVWFKYSHSPEWVLKGVSLEIGAGENVALVGENGAGKTTMIKLLCGFYQPQKGKILVNGVPVQEYQPSSYRRLLSVLFQEFEEYPFSARETIGYGDVRRMKDEEAVKQAAEATKIDQVIEKWPRKYKQPVNRQLAHGIEPSKGQWQRLALARALFKQAPVLILDEPTSNVDPKAEEEIFNDLISLNAERTIILISHRFATVRRADKIFVVDEGEVKEAGSHEELMKKDGVYAKLFRIQAKGYQ